MGKYLLSVSICDTIMVMLWRIYEEEVYAFNKKLDFNLEPWYGGAIMLEYRESMV